MSDGAPAVRERAADSLERLHDASAHDALVRALAIETDPHARLAIADACEALAGP